MSDLYTEKLALEYLDEESRRNYSSCAVSLNNFVNSIYVFKTGKNDDNTNIIDQNKCLTFNLPNEQHLLLFNNLEECRKKKITNHFSEKQYSNSTSHSGIMLDFDILCAEKKVMSEKQYFYITNAIINIIQKHIRGNSEELLIHVFFIIQEVSVIKKVDDKIKNGFHILIPSIKITKTFKKLLLNEIANDEQIKTILIEYGTININNCLDMNSASVPVLFFGSCKRGNIPYVLGCSMEVVLHSSTDESEILTMSDEHMIITDVPRIRIINESELEKLNLVAELSLNLQYDLVKKYVFSCPEQKDNEIYEYENDENDLSILTIHNVDAKEVCDVLSILPDDYSSDRNKWRNVIYALANQSEQFKPIGIWFSKKCKEKYDYSYFNNLWNEASINKSESNITIKSIYYWAKISNPIKFNEIIQRSYFITLITYAYEHNGKIQHSMISKILHKMLSSKFCTDTEGKSKSGKEIYHWYEFVLPDQTMKYGEVWKWRRESDPDDIQLFISEKLPDVFVKIIDYFNELQNKVDCDEKSKYYKKVLSALATSKNNLFHDTFKNGIIKQCIPMFRRRGFIESLDTDPFLFGTVNGILKLGNECILIDYYHEYSISKYSPVIWKKYDENDEWVQIAMNAIKDIIPEEDARDWIMFHACQGLSGDLKEGLLLLWEGGGQNGKTSFLRWIAKSLGPYADKFNIQLMCCEREGAEKPNSAMMRFKQINYAYAEESNKAQMLNCARMKEMVNAGEVSGRDLNCKQETFSMHCNIVAASQFSFVIDTTDHGTWRRIRHYNSKVKFRKNPDVSNPLEKADDQRFVREYPSNPNFQSAILSILTHYYERLQNEYNGELKKVKSNTIERETEEFRVTQDALHKWICENIVISPDCDEKYQLSALCGFYIDWYSSNIGGGKKQVQLEIIKSLESSAISAYLKPSLNNKLVMMGCRVLTPTETELRDGERFISVIRHL